MKNIEQLQKEFDEFLQKFDEEKLEDWIKFDNLRMLLYKITDNYVCNDGYQYIKCPQHHDRVGGCLACVKFAKK